MYDVVFRVVCVVDQAYRGYLTWTKPVSSAPIICGYLISSRSIAFSTLCVLSHRDKNGIHLDIKSYFLRLNMGYDKPNRTVCSGLTYVYICISVLLCSIFKLCYCGDDTAVVSCAFCYSYVRTWFVRCVRAVDSICSPRIVICND